MRALETSLSRSQQSRILGCCRGENEFKVKREPLKHRFFDVSQVAFWAYQEEENLFPVHGDHLNNRFVDLTKVEIWACQEAELPFINLIRHFIDLKKVAFSVGKEADNDFIAFSTSSK